MAHISNRIIMNSPNMWRLIVAAVGLVLFTGESARAQESDSANAEIRLLRGTNERLVRENEALRDDVEALRKTLADRGASTRPAALSAGSGAASAAPAKKIVFIMD